MSHLPIEFRIAACLTLVVTLWQVKKLFGL